MGEDVNQYLNVGNDPMPIVGFGLWKIAQAHARDVVYNAISEGYRHLDSACDYGNEKAVGEGINAALRQGLCTRESLWVTSKLWNTYHAPEHVEAACRRSLADLQLDYLDLYLIHFPIALRYVDFDERYPPEWLFDPSAEQPRMETAAIPLHETWRAMEALVDKGLVKHIGVCNYNAVLLHDLMAYARIKPSMLQVELHPYLQQQALLRTASQYHLPITAFSPLGSASYVELGMATETDSVLGESLIADIAQRLQRTPAQVVLRWSLQRGTAVIPKSSLSERRLENLALFDFCLSSEDMAAINTLERGRRFNNPADFCELAFNHFHAIYE